MHAEISAAHYLYGPRKDDHCVAEDVVVVGGGAAGLLSAIGAAEQGAAVTLLERNPKLGIKILMSGGGRCNITNTGDVAHLVDSFPGNGRFLYSAFHAFSNDDILALLSEEGVPTRVEDRGRVFPTTNTAMDVVAALERRAVRLGARIRKRALVRTISRREAAHGFTIVMEDGEELHADRLIITTGGISYPTSGSTGDGYVWARQFGHTIVKPRPSIVGLETVEEWPAEVKGVALRDVTAHVRVRGRQTAAYREDVLFTHFGLSGPAVLNVSHQAVVALEETPGEVEIAIRLEYETRPDEWEKRLMAALQESPRRQLQNVLARWWPSSLAPVLLRLHGIHPELEAAQVPKADRVRTAQLLHELVLTVKRPRPLKDAMVTAGGVSVKEVNPRTMGSRLVPGLYFAGEILDVDGVSGGYNLQGAYSTGYLAGKSAALGKQ